MHERYMMNRNLCSSASPLYRLVILLYQDRKNWFFVHSVGKMVIGYLFFCRDTVSGAGRKFPLIFDKFI